MPMLFYSNSLVLFNKSAELNNYSNKMTYKAFDSTKSISSNRFLETKTAYSMDYNDEKRNLLNNSNTVHSKSLEDKNISTNEILIRNIRESGIILAYCLIILFSFLLHLFIFYVFELKKVLNNDNFQI